MELDINNKTVTFVETPRRIKKIIFEEFAMGWSEKKQGGELTLRFLKETEDGPCFRIEELGKEIEFDRDSTCYVWI